MCTADRWYLIDIAKNLSDMAPIPNKKTKSPANKHVVAVGPTNKFKKKERKANPRQFSNYIYKVHKKVVRGTKNDDLGLSKKAMVIMNDFVNDTFNRIMREAAALVEKNNQKTLDYWDIHIATKLVLRGGNMDLTRYATTFGTKAVKRYLDSIGRPMRKFFRFVN